MFWEKHQLRMHFIQNLSLSFLSFLDLYLNESGSSDDNNWCYPWYYGIVLLAGAIESKVCGLSILKIYMNLNGIPRLYGLMGRKYLDNKFQVLTNV